MKKYDLVIIGSGVGLSFVNDALDAGMSLALVENSKFGGTCLTRGCIPSKILVYPADVIRLAQHAKKVGLSFDPPKIDWDVISKRMRKKIDTGKNIESSLDGIKGLDVYKGTGEFTENYTMKVKFQGGEYSDEFIGEKFIIASGARTFVPPIKGLDDTGYITSETFFDKSFPQKPWKSLVIVGGGAIGSEFAHIFSAYGTKVTVIEMMNRLVLTEETEISEHLLAQFKQNSIDVHLNHKAIEAKKEAGLKKIIIEDVNTGERQSISAEEILISAGVRSNTDLLKIENTDIALDRRGWIETNKFLETSQKNVWALGDINGKFQFRHKANYEAQILSHNLFNLDEEKKQAEYTKIPWAIFTHPQIAHVGLTESQALEKHDKILVGKNHYSSVAKGFAMGYEKGADDDGFVKLLADQNHKIIGAHIIGPYAAILIHSFLYLMNAGYTCTMHGKSDDNLSELDKSCIEGGTFYPMYDTIVIHPSLSEVAGWILGKLKWVSK